MATLKITLKQEHVYVHAPRGVLKGDPTYLLLPHADGSDELWAYLGQCDLHGALELPDGFDVRERMIAGLKEQKKRVMAEAERDAVEIERKIAELLAIEAPKRDAAGVRLATTVEDVPAIRRIIMDDDEVPF